MCFHLNVELILNVSNDGAGHRTPREKKKPQIVSQGRGDLCTIFKELELLTLRTVFYGISTRRSLCQDKGILPPSLLPGVREKKINSGGVEQLATGAKLL